MNIVRITNKSSLNKVSKLRYSYILSNNIRRYSSPINNRGYLQKYGYKLEMVANVFMSFVSLSFILLVIIPLFCWTLFKFVDYCNFAIKEIDKQYVKLVNNKKE